MSHKIANNACFSADTASFTAIGPFPLFFFHVHRSYQAYHARLDSVRVPKSTVHASKRSAFMLLIALFSFLLEHFHGPVLRAGIFQLGAFIFRPFMRYPPSPLFFLLYERSFHGAWRLWPAVLDPLFPHPFVSLGIYMGNKVSLRRRSA
jgi:hypothetical protein